MTTKKKHFIYYSLFIFLFLFSISSCSKDTDIIDEENNEDNLPDVTGYPIISTNQTLFYNNSNTISEPVAGESFYGQDAHFSANEPIYKDNNDGTVTDILTGLMWQQGLFDNKYDYDDCVNYADTCSLAGYDDWRLPTIKELYSLILFSGSTGTDENSADPYLDSDVFEFRFGTEFGERYIDAQYATSTIYTATTMGGNETMFGVNFADGRIKGYPTSKEFEIKLVRGRSDYGTNNFNDNGDGTVSDAATGLMWDQNGSEGGMNWEEAFDYVMSKNSENYLGFSDWRLPDAKELHSIVDYSKSPEYSGSAAIASVFNIPEITNEGGESDYPWYISSTTHDDGLSPDKAVYVCFGRALGYWQDIWQDVHGAGAQRSDLKIGNPEDYPNGFGPQGDAIRIYNYVRLVRDIN
jgi:hypothetical protein